MQPFLPKSANMVYGRLVFVMNRLASSLMNVADNNVATKWEQRHSMWVATEWDEETPVNKEPLSLRQGLFCMLRAAVPPATRFAIQLLSDFKEKC